MSAETLIHAGLIANAGVTAVIGAAAAARCYPDFLVQEIELPAIVTQRASTEYTNTIHGGPPIATDAFMDSWCMGATRLAAELLADLVVIALANAGFLVTDRRQEFDQETITYMAVVTCRISL